MAKSKKFSKSRIDSRRQNTSPSLELSRGPFDISLQAHASQRSSKDTFSLVEPQINAEGAHIWPFDISCPVDVLFMATHDRQRVRMNRHGYFEVLYLGSGSGVCHIQDRLLPFNEGDLAVIGSTLYHRIECCSEAPLSIVALFFEPGFICCDGASDSAEYLTPFLLQDEKFPHVISPRSGVPRQILDMMLRIQSELPAASPRARLAVKTYLKMLLMLLVNEYAPYAGTVETFRRQQHDLDRLNPLFRYLAEHLGDAVQVHQAARVCGMSESRFMSFFKKVTGLSFVAYFNHVRIERAQTLLAKTDEPLLSISQQVGFCDQSYFGAVFRKIVGMTPAAYRSRCSSAIVPDQRQVTHYHPASSFAPSPRTRLVRR